MVEYPPKRQATPKGLRVICVKWGDKYGEEYVYKLESMCARHLPPHEFLCITDNPVPGVACNPLVCDLPGWWQKIGLFQPGLFPGRNMYIDLDVVITQSLNPLVSCLALDDSVLWSLDDFGYPLRNPRSVSGETLRLLGGKGTINSSVMLWRGGSSVHKVWTEFKPAIMDELHGDQNHITRVLYPEHVKFLPDGYAKSYKYGNRAQAPIVIFHGSPKNHEVEDDWVKQHWTT